MHQNRESEQLFAIAENEEEKEEDEDGLIQSPSRIRRPTSRHGSPDLRGKSGMILETPGNEESKFSFSGKDPF